MIVHIGAYPLDISGIACTSNAVVIENGVARPGRGPSLYDPFSPPAAFEGFDEYGMPTIYDPHKDIARIRQALASNPIELALDSVCNQFYPEFDAAVAGGRVTRESGRVALIHYHSFGIQAMLFFQAEILAYRGSIHAGIIQEGILHQEIVSFRTGRTAIDRMPYWEICCIDPNKGEF